jgi:hypothetical protein
MQSEAINKEINKPVSSHFIYNASSRLQAAFHITNVQLTYNGVILVKSVCLVATVPSIVQRFMAAVENRSNYVYD